MKRACEGYCGGYVRVGNVHQVGPDGARFCPACYGQWLRQQYHDELHQ